MSRAGRHRLSRLAWTALALASGAIFLFIIVIHEGIGLFSGLWWKSESDVWTVDRSGTRILVGVHPVGETAPLAVMITNAGDTPLVNPFVSADSRDPWLPFEEQVAGVVADVPAAADRAAALVEWVRNRLAAADNKPGTTDLEMSPWRVLYAFGYGNCNDLAALIALAAQAAEMPARIVYLQGHAAPEIEYDGAWHVYDPVYSFSFYDEDGRVPDAETVVKRGKPSDQIQTRRPPVLTTAVDRAWSRIEKVRPVEDLQIPTLPAPELTLLAGDSWWIEATTQKKLLAGREGAKDVPAGRGTMLLRLPFGKRELHLPFPILQASLIVEGEKTPDWTAEATINAGEAIEPGTWEKAADGAYHLPLLDRRAEPTPCYDLTVSIPNLDWYQVGLLVETAVAAHWIPTPRPGLTTLTAGWKDGQRMKVRLSWRRR